MGGSGAAAHPRDGAVLTAPESDVSRAVEAARFLLGRGIYPGCRRVAAALGWKIHRAWRAMRVARGSGLWPCVVRSHAKVAGLTDREASVYQAARRLHESGVYPSAAAIGRELGLAVGHVLKIRMGAVVKVAWPFPIHGVPGGASGITPAQRRVLLAAYDLVENGEYPSAQALAAYIGQDDPSTVIGHRKVLVARGLFPARVKPRAVPYGPEVRELVLRLRRDGLGVTAIIDEVWGRFSRRMSEVTVWRIVNGVRGRRGPVASLESRKRAVIDGRAGLCPAKIEEPSGSRRRAQPRG